MKKQILTILLLALLPVAAMAGKKGKCGPNVTYDFEKETGVLTIEGSGPMQDDGKMVYKKGSTSTQIPTNLPEYSKYADKITSVVIKEGVTAVGNLAFYGLDKVTSVIIPNSVASIGDHAFAWCSSLHTISIPNSVKVIKDAAFMGAALDTVTIPDGVTEICNQTFYSTKLTSVKLPAGLTRIGAHAFAWCYNLSSILIPYSVKNIEDYAFHKCGKLTTVHIANRNTAVDKWAFDLGKYELPVPRIVYGEADKPLMAQATPKPTEAKKPGPVVQPKAEPKPATQPVVQGKPAPKSAAQPVAAPQLPKEQVANVDENIPVASQYDKNTFAVIIGNEKYDNEADVPFAENDARVFKEYVQRTLGVPEKQIRFVTNAGLNSLRMAVRWLAQAMEVSDGQGRAIFYYAGHGIPNEKDQSAYLLPTDGMGSDPESAYPLDKLYQQLGKVPTQRTTVFLDACFSGSKREGGMMASARGVAIKAKASEPQGKMVVFTAAQGDETAYPYKSQQHGMFTYFVLRKLQDTKGDVSLGELGDYLRREVKRESFVENNKMQTPSVTASAALQASWRTLKLK